MKIDHVAIVAIGSLQLNIANAVEFNHIPHPAAKQDGEKD
jgi:hypothetical protein